MPNKLKVIIPGGCQGDLAGIIDQPDGKAQAHALFAHCFTCGKDSVAAARIGSALSAEGIACLRFDFTGLGDSRGDFSRTTLTSNIADLKAAAHFLRWEEQPAQLLIGHSLGGVAATLGVAELSEVRGLVLLNPPPRATHVLDHFGSKLEIIEREGEARVPIYDTTGKRQFLIRRELVDDLRRYDFAVALKKLRVPLLVLYSENDDLIGQSQIQELFQVAPHPKKLEVLKGADHILSNRDIGLSTGKIIAEWFISMNRRG